VHTESFRTSTQLILFNMKTPISTLVKLGACHDALAWCRTNSMPDLETAWLKCPRGEWMEWLAAKRNVDPAKLADYEAKRAPLDADYEAKRAPLDADYEAKCAPLDADWRAKRAALDAGVLAYIRSVMPDCAWNGKKLTGTEG